MNTLSNRKNQMPKPILYYKKQNCCGCTVCYNNCEFHAITMQPDEEGFLYPVIYEELCVRCGKCLTNCIFKEQQKMKGYL